MFVAGFIAVLLLVNSVVVDCAQLAGKVDISSDGSEKKADLLPLINETLSINNKSIKNATENQANSGSKDDWTFDMVEYDLMDFLRDLSGRYKLNNLTDRPTFSSQDDYLAGRKSQSELNVSTTAKPLQAEHSTLINKTIETVEPAEQNPVKLVPLAPTTELPTSLASDDHEIGESSWQYGIFDRFTRPRTTSTTTTPEPKFTLTDGKIDMRQFNSDECGLRTYEVSENVFSAYPDQFLLESAQSEVSKTLSQRRQKIPPLPPIYQKKQYEQLASETLANDDNKESWSSKSEKDAYDSFKNNKEAGAFADQPPTASSYPTDNSGNSEFNLASRRYWLQQQLGSTLQLLGFNSSSQSVAEFLNQTSGLSLNMRENMMKKSNPIVTDRSSKSLSATELKDLLQMEKELKARQDELKLEARVIGGNDAKLGDSPWSVSLQALVSRPGTAGVEYRHYCGGTIISEHYVLTAAHCLDFMVGRESRLFVVIGDLNWRMSTSSLYGRRFGIEKLIIHGGYKSTAFGHDIGLIKTKESMKPLKVNGKYIVNSVCLPEKNVEHSGEAELVGWGLFSNRNEMADSLQIADVPILPRPLCVDLYRRRTGLIQWFIGIELITDKQVCAGTFGRGICQGDSGSALVVNEKVSHTILTARDEDVIKPVDANLLRNINIQRDSDEKDLVGKRTLSLRQTQQTKATIIGVVAFGGIRRCSYQSLPGVYMQTSKYLDWILPRIQN